MTEATHRIFKLLQDDPRYKLEAYQFVREALSYAHEVLELGGSETVDVAPDESGARPGQSTLERHLTGQQLCEAIRQYAQEQYGYMAKVVLNSWGLHSTGDFGNIVYNLIGIGLMKKSKTDRREDFDDVFEFDEALQEHFQISRPDAG